MGNIAICWGMEDGSDCIHYFKVSHCTSCFSFCGQSYRICQSQFWQPAHYSLFCYMCM